MLITKPSGSDRPGAGPSALPAPVAAPLGDDEIDLGAVWFALRRHGLLIAGLALLAAVITFGVAVLRPPTYEASTSLLTSGLPNVNGIRDTLVASSPLPEGALQEALNSSVVMEDILQQISSSRALDSGERLHLTHQVEQEYRHHRIQSIELDPHINFNGDGVYIVHARARTAAASAVLCDAVTAALLTWDGQRTLGGLERATRSLRAQLSEVERQLQRAGLSALDNQTLLSTRALLQQKLAQASVQAEGVSGVLELVAPAAVPFDRIAPRPLRTALLAFVLSAIVGAAVAAVLALTNRSIRREDDLIRFGVPVLGTVPLPVRGRSKEKSASKGPEGQADAVGFLGLALMSGLDTAGGRSVLVSSVEPVEESRAIVDELALSVISGGYRVVVIDADQRISPAPDVQESMGGQWVQLVGHGGARSLAQAALNPGNVQVEAQPSGVHVLPAGLATDDTRRVIARGGLGEPVETWGASYDVVLVAGPPMTAAATVSLARNVDHAVLVVQQGGVQSQVVDQALRRLTRAGVHILGLVLVEDRPPRLGLSRRAVRPSGVER